MTEQSIERPSIDKVNPLIGDFPGDTLDACANSISFLQRYVQDNEELKNCPTAQEGFYWTLENIRHALLYEFERSTEAQRPKLVDRAHGPGGGDRV